MQAVLALEDGRVFRGEAFGSPVERVGEVVFNTSLTGYQEIFTDPSYAGQIVVLTNPHIGNYGTTPSDARPPPPPAASPWPLPAMVDEASAASSYACRGMAAMAVTSRRATVTIRSIPA